MSNGNQDATTPGWAEAPTLAPVAPLAGKTIEAMAGRVGLLVAMNSSPRVRGVRERLATLVERLDRFVTTSSGPAGYPWKALQSLRSELGDLFMRATEISRDLSDFESVVRAFAPGFSHGMVHPTLLGQDAPETVDVKHEVELGLAFAAHRLTQLELFVDVGSVPMAKAARGVLALIVAEMLTLSAESAHQLPGSSISVRASVQGQRVLIAVADNGAGNGLVPHMAAPFAAALRIQDRHVVCESVAGRGCAFELRLRVAPSL